MAYRSGQNIIHYQNRIYGTDEVAELTKYTERAIQLIARQLGIGEMVKGRLQFTAADIDALRQRRKMNLGAKGSPIIRRANELISEGVERVDAFAQANKERNKN